MSSFGIQLPPTFIETLVRRRVLRTAMLASFLGLVAAVICLVFFPPDLAKEQAAARLAGEPEPPYIALAINVFLQFTVIPTALILAVGFCVNQSWRGVFRAMAMEYMASLVCIGIGLGAVEALYDISAGGVAWVWLVARGAVLAGGLLLLFIRVKREFRPIPATPLDQ